ncbi:hypothetical protein E4U21_002248 [Claviceps maximensis]|nr:hypothetical protein E4U21_002248 [Claviceps maximensis]
MQYYHILDSSIDPLDTNCYPTPSYGDRKEGLTATQVCRIRLAAALSLQPKSKDELT